MAQTRRLNEELIMFSFRNRLSMKSGLAICFVCLYSGLFAQIDPPAVSLYYPEKHHWEHMAAESFGLDQAAIDSAVAFHQSHESNAPKDQELAQTITFGKEPFGEGVGAFDTRGPATGLIIHRGYILAEWGEPSAVEMTHSVSKSFLSAVVGLAEEAGEIVSLQDKVFPYLPPIELYQPGKETSEVGDMGEFPLYEPFETTHNQTITWDHLLRQTSDWEGTLWGKPDWADRPAKDLQADMVRARNASGSVWEYNDTRVNVLALAATMVWRKPLPQVLREEIMDPIGASHLWQWRGYRNSWIVLDGAAVNVVSGGGHWGGGMFINAYDMARFGLLMMRDGIWEEEQIIPASFIENARTPTAVKPGYGYMNWFLNTDRELLPSAPETAVAFLGNGTNMVYFDYEHELVIVARWLDRHSLDGMVEAVLAAWE